MSGFPFFPITPAAPTIIDFQTFIANVMRIPAAYLPPSDPMVQHAFDYAFNTTNLALQVARSQPTSWSPYALAVLNLGGHVLIEYANDQLYSISAASWANGLATITTSAVNAIQVGDNIGISGVSPYAYDQGSGDPPGFVVNAVIDNQHFNYALSPNPGTATISETANVSEQFFMRARLAYRMNAFSPGVVTNSSDLSTSVGLLNPEFMRNLPFEALDLLKTPFGRAYLSIAQKYGPSIWGLT